MATDTPVQSGSYGGQPITSTVTESVLSSAAGRATAKLLAETMWQPDAPLPHAHLAGGAATAVAQNGRTSLENTSGVIRALAEPPLRVPLLVRHPERFVTLAKWIGRVQRVDEDSFVALVQDQLETERPTEEAEFARCEVSPADEPLLQTGAVFYWSIGYRDRLGGQRTRESVIHFRRLPAPSLVDHAAAEEWAGSVRAIMDGA